MKKILSLILFTFCFLTGKSQLIFPPHLSCVSNEVNGDVSLTWITPNNPCGAFVSYIIYGSNTGKNGPYNIIATISIQGQTTYTFAGANGNTTTWYFYMVSDFNCPGYTATNSDTIDNQDPLPPVMNFVTVSGEDATTLNWQQGASPQTYGYIIYKVVGGNNVPIDTIIGKAVTTYTDYSSSPSTEPVGYKIAAIDSCGRTGTISAVEHKTIFLSGSVTNCKPTGALSWMPYMGWIVDHYIVYDSVNANKFVPILTTKGTSATFSYTSDNVCLKVVAYSASGADSSSSNIICFSGSQFSPISDFYLRNVTVTSPGQNDVYFSANPSSDILSMKIERSSDGIDYASIDVVQVPTNLNTVNFYSDQGASNGENSYYYRFIATDSCGNIDTSSTGKSIVLNGYAFTNFNNHLNWDESVMQYGTILNYRVYRNPNAAPIAILSPATFVYEEDVSALVGDTGTLCYLVEAEIAMSFPNGVTDTVYSRSNVKCLDQIIKITVPNAFAPEGQNKIFKPVMRFTGNKSYLFEIYNRWGGLIFSTKDFSKGWDGTHNGKLVEQGVYVYDIQVIDSNGKNTEKKGTVMVLRH